VDTHLGEYSNTQIPKHPSNQQSAAEGMLRRMTETETQNPAEGFQ
jgi:hypothetical protein